MKDTPGLDSDGFHYQGKKENRYMNLITLETQRLILRAFTIDDLEAMFLIFSDQEVNTYLPWFPLQSIEDAKQFFEERFAKSTDYKYAICLKEDNIPIGYIHISADDSHDFGYGLRKEFWRQGIVSEASRALLSQVKKDGLPYVTATHDVNNPHSGYVMKSLGMKYQYSYEELWQPKNYLVTFRMYQLNFREHDDFVYKKYWNMYDKHFIEENIE